MEINALLKRVKSVDPAGIPPKILSSGWSSFLRVGVIFTIYNTVLALLGHSFSSGASWCCRYKIF